MRPAWYGVVQHCPHKSCLHAAHRYLHTPGNEMVTTVTALTMTASPTTAITMYNLRVFGECEAHHSCQGKVCNRVHLLCPAEARLGSNLCRLILHNIFSMHSDFGALTKSRSRTHSQQSKMLLQLLHTCFIPQSPQDCLTWITLKKSNVVKSNVNKSRERNRGDTRHIVAEVQLPVHCLMHCCLLT